MADLIAQRRANMARLLLPKSVCFIGGQQIVPAVEATRAMGFAGKMFAVHPKGASLGGLASAKRVFDLPEVPDAAFLMTPTEATIEVVRELAAMGTGGAVCYAAGFAEAGEAGRALQDKLVAAAGPLAVVGPNCYGLINCVNGGSLWPLAHGRHAPGQSVAIVSQSGNIGINIANAQRSVPMSHLVSVGNQAVLGVEDFVAYFAEQPHIKAIGVFLEGLRDVPAFHRAAEAALRRGVAIVVLKSGASQVGAKLAMSHTSSIAGADSLYDALFKRLGIARVRSVPELLETVKLFAVWGGARGRRTVYFTTSGGDAGLAADHSDAAGLVLPQPTPAQAADLRAILPPYGTVSNPLDFTAPLWGREEPLAKLFAATMREGADQAVLVIDNPVRDPDGHPGVVAMIRALDRAKAETGIAAAMAATNPESFPEPLRLDMLARGMAPMQGVHDAIRAIAGAAAFTEARARVADLASAPAAVPPVDAARARIWEESESKAALKAFGLPVPEGRVVEESQVAEVARTLGFPVAIKAASADLPHKTEAGAVVLGIADEAAARAAAARIRADATRRAKVDVTRFLVERMAPKPVVELIVGVTRDPQFGLALVIGAGGVLVELVRASVSLLLPTTRAEVEAALAQGPVGRLLAGYRGGPKGDADAAAEAILAVARFAEANAHRLVELDVNPLFVLPQGAVAVDALVRAAD